MAEDRRRCREEPITVIKLDGPAPRLETLVQLGRSIVGTAVPNATIVTEPIGRAERVFRTAAIGSAIVTALPMAAVLGLGAALR